jgi:hypothetical protein
MKGGDDLIIAHFYGNDTDIVKGGSGYDRIYVNDGDTRPPQARRPGPARR